MPWPQWCDTLHRSAMLDAHGYSAPPLSRGDRVRRKRMRVPRALRIIAAAAVTLGALGLLFASAPPGASIRASLAAAAAALDALPPNAAAKDVRTALLPAFAGRDVVIDPAGFPREIAVTLQGIDRRACIAAVQSVRRLEGRVVVELQTYRSPDDCGAENAMTWRLMP
jgi:hypothetical protein